MRSVSISGTNGRDRSVARFAFFLVGALLASCSSSSSSNSGGGPDAAAGAGSKQKCDLPACYTNFEKAVATCVPGGACVEQKVKGAMPSLSVCWANGVKERVALTAAGQGASATATVSNGAGACYSFAFTIDSNGDIGPVLDFRDGAGKSAFTLTDNGDGTITVACAGGPSKVVPDDCDVGMMDTMMMPGKADTMCTEGMCM